MNRLLIVLFAITGLFSCSSSKKLGGVNYGSPKVKQELLDDYTFKISIYSQDKTYGYTENNPIMVGGALSDGPQNERRFINALCGPNGEQLEYYRIGSCCPFKTKSSEWGGMLDMYNVKYRGLEEGLILYINMYDSDTLKVPVGLNFKY